ncbi:MAG: hypothetical protein ABSG79_11035 [Bryobacteraceae bacterium]
MEIGVHALLEVAKIDAMVDDTPQVAVLESGPGNGLRIMNCNAPDQFEFQCREIDQIKKRLEGIEQKRTQVFHLLAALALHFAHYNFCGIHGSLRITPAMAAGITDRVWEIENLISTL